MVATVDSTLQQFAADGLLLILIAVNAALGWRTGTVRRVLSFAGLYVGIVAAFYIGNGIAGVIDKGSLYANAWTFLGVTVIVVLGFELIGRLFSDRIDRILVLAFDRFAGMLVGAAVGFFQALLVFLVALSVGAAPSLLNNSVPPGRAAAADAIRGATLSGQAVRAEPALQRIISPLLSTDLTNHFLEGTSVSPSVH
jgi:uncharacterized membrane protein required for colicin V production